MSISNAALLMWVTPLMPATPRRAWAIGHLLVLLRTGGAANASIGAGNALRHAAVRPRTAATTASGATCSGRCGGVASAAASTEVPPPADAAACTSTCTSDDAMCILAAITTCTIGARAGPTASLCR